MSDVLDGIGDDLDEDAVSRRRSIWGLLVLACVAIIVACLMILLGGSKGDKQGQPPPVVDTGNPVTVLPRSNSPSSSEGSESSASKSAGVSTPPANVHSGNPCPDQKSCTVDGDAGLVTAINKFRQDEGQKPVDGVVSENAKKCALSRGGDSSSCVPHWAWTNVPKQDAAAALDKFKGFNRGWMLDSSMKKIEVGWAWNGSGWDVALLKSP